MYVCKGKAILILLDVESEGCASILLIKLSDNCIWWASVNSSLVRFIIIGNHSPSKAGSACSMTTLIFDSLQ